MRDFGNKVPFDPGFYTLSFPSIESVDLSYKKMKATSQKKFWLIKAEPILVEFINRNTAFFLGCMLWGAFLHFRFKDSPKEIEGNFNASLQENEKKEIDCADETKKNLEEIKILNRDCKYFLNRSANIPDFIVEILNNYIEFSQINENFTKTKTTDDIKIPKVFEHFNKYSPEKLDELCEKIYSVIETKQIIDLLDLKFYNVE